MKNSSSGKGRCSVRIDRIVVDGIGGLPDSSEAFRRQVAAELQRKLARPAVVDGIESQRRERVTVRLSEQSAPSSAAGLAGRIVEILQNSSSHQR